MLYKSFNSKILVPFLLIAVLFFIGCDNENIVSSGNKEQILTTITAQPSILYYGAKTELIVNVMDSNNDSLSFRWGCNEGSFVGETTSNKVTWQAPNELGSYRVNVTVSNGYDSTTSEVDIQVTAVFFDYFTNGLDAWTKSYCDAWIETEEAHMEGNNNDYWATLYHNLNVGLKPDYTIEMKVKNVDRFYTDDLYGLYSKVSDPASGPYNVSLKYWWLQIFPGSSVNWRIICFISSDIESDWFLLSEDSYGYSPAIESNDWNHISWSVDADKKISVNVNNTMLFQSDEIKEIENYFNISVTMNLQRIGCRFDQKEIKMDDVLVTTPGIPGTVPAIASDGNVGDMSVVKRSKKSNGSFSQSSTKLRTLKEFLKNH